MDLVRSCLSPAAYSMPKLWADSETVDCPKTQSAPAPEKEKVQAEVNAGFLKSGLTCREPRSS